MTQNESKERMSLLSHLRNRGREVNATRNRRRSSRMPQLRRTWTDLRHAARSHRGMESRDCRRRTAPAKELSMARNGAGREPNGPSCQHAAPGDRSPRQPSNLNMKSTIPPARSTIGHPHPRRPVANPKPQILPFRLFAYSAGPSQKIACHSAHRLLQTRHARKSSHTKNPLTARPAPAALPSASSPESTAATAPSMSTTRGGPALFRRLLRHRPARG
jgi:hypothetical protein